MKVKIEIDVPDIWNTENISEYLESQNKIKCNWAKMLYFTGNRAETWVRNHTKSRDSMIPFYEAVEAVEAATFAVINKFEKENKNVPG